MKARVEEETVRQEKSSSEGGSGSERSSSVGWVGRWWKQDGEWKEYERV